jgi:hypothetical protein
MKAAFALCLLLTGSLTAYARQVQNQYTFACQTKEHCEKACNVLSASASAVVVQDKGGGYVLLNGCLSSGSENECTRAQVKIQDLVASGAVKPGRVFVIDNEPASWQAFLAGLVDPGERLVKNPCLN